MEKRNTMLLTIIAIATLLVAVIGATFAYFATTTNINANIPVNINTPGENDKSSFTAVASGDINVSVDAYKMQQADATAETEVTTRDDLTSNSSLNIVLKSGTANQQSKCTYSIIWTWTSEKYAIAEATESNPNPAIKHYWPTTDVPKEFTIQGVATQTNTETGTTLTELEETNFSAFIETTKTLSDSSTVDIITLVKDASIITKNADTGGIVKWDFTVRFYNSRKDQSALMGKNFTGTISVDPDSVRC